MINLDNLQWILYPPLWDVVEDLYVRWFRSNSRNTLVDHCRSYGAPPGNMKYRSYRSSLEYVDPQLGIGGRWNLLDIQTR